MIDGTNSRIESSLTGAEGKFSAPVSRLEQIILGEDIKPLSRIEEVMTDYVKTHGNGGELSTNDGKTKALYAFNEETLYGTVDEDIIYNPHHWTYKNFDEYCMPAGIDENGNWHVIAYHTGNATVGNQGTYIHAINPKYVSRIDFSIKLNENSFYPTSTSFTEQPCFALLRRPALPGSNFGDSGWGEYGIVKRVIEKYYTEDGVIKMKDRITDSFMLSSYDEPVYFAYYIYGLDATFDRIEFVLKEE